MKNLPIFVSEPELWDDDPYFRDLLKQAEFANMTDRQQERYIAKMMHEWDYENSISYAREKGHKAGWESGLKKGREEGREEGREAERINTARRMLEKQYTAEAIAELTGLTEEQVRAL